MVLHQHVGEYVVATFQYHPLLEIVKGGFVFNIPLFIPLALVNNITTKFSSLPFYCSIKNKSKYKPINQLILKLKFITLLQNSIY